MGVNVRHSKLVGVTFNNRQDNIEALESGFRLFWEHQKDNPYDENAILCYADPTRTKEVGHLNRELAKDFVERKEKGVQQIITVAQVTGGGKDKQSYGVNIEIREIEEDE